MADMTAHLKSAMWTEAEVIAVGAGAVIASKFLDDTKLFKTKFAQNPAWFQGSRAGAPFLVKWSGGIKAAGAVIASTYVSNPWLKLALMGVAFQGTVQQFRVLTFDNTNQVYRYNPIGTTKEVMLDQQLKQLAQQNRMSGMADSGNRYKTSVGEVRPDSGNRYKTSVGMGKKYSDGMFSLRPYDRTGAF